MKQIIPGIYQLKVPIPHNPLENTNTYLLRGDDGYLLIDAGMNNDESFKGLEKELAEAGVAFSDITRIIVTHSHPDHYGLAGRIQEMSKAPIYAHRLVKDNLQGMRGGGEGRMQQMEQWLHRHGVPPFNPAEMPGPRVPQGGGRPGEASGQGAEVRRPSPFPNHAVPDVTLQGDETITFGDFILKLFWTPGHDASHICLYESTKKVFFAGDHVLPVISPHVTMRDESDINPLGDFLNSLKKVRELDVQVVLPGHEQTFTNLRGRVDELTKHHERRHDEILEALKTAAKTAYAISNEITWMPSLGGRKFMELSPWDRRAAVTETLAHLKEMELRGRVATFSSNSTVYYQRAG